jgi:Protein of unknown function (DUF3015)
MKTASVIRVLFAIAILGAGVSPALAQAPMVQVQPQIANNTNIAGFGMAGCGLGSMLFGKQTGIIQVLAATTNGCFGSQTFGITSGTSNCTDTGGGPMSSRSFVETNREAVAKDISRGKGETIASLSTLAGCKDSKQVGAVLQTNFSKIFPSASVKDHEAGDNVVQVLRGHPELSCKNLI